MPSIIWKRTGKEVLTLCWKGSLLWLGKSHYFLLAASITIGSFCLSFLCMTQGAKILALTIYLITLNSFIMLVFAMILVPLSCLSSLDLLMRLTPTTNPYSLVYRWKFSGLLIVIFYGFSTVSMVMTITSWGKLFSCGVKRYHYEKFIGIRELSERLSINWFNRNLKTDTRTPKTPLLDEVNCGETFSTCRSIHFSSSVSLSTQGSTIFDLNINIASFSASTFEVCTLGLQHNADKGADKCGVRYNRTVRGLCNRRFPNIRIYLKRNLWRFNGCNKFNMIPYYCNNLVCYYFVTHLDFLVRHR